MTTFRNRRLRDHTLPMSTAWLLNDIAEAKGKQELFTRQSPQVLKTLRGAAIIQSAESANRIEGVTAALERLRPLVLGNNTPRDRSEQELQDYRTALNKIHTQHEELSITALDQLLPRDCLSWLCRIRAARRAGQSPAWREDRSCSGGD